MSEKKEFLYVMGTEAVIELCDTIKIGVTKDIEQRRKEHGTPFKKLECYYTRPGTKEDEATIHSDLSKYRDHTAPSKEVFKLRDPKTGLIDEDIHVYLIEFGFVEYESPEEDDVHNPVHPDGFKFMLETMINGWATNMASMERAIGASPGCVFNWLNSKQPDPRIDRPAHREKINWLWSVFQDEKPAPFDTGRPQKTTGAKRVSVDLQVTTDLLTLNEIIIGYGDRFSVTAMATER